MCMDFECLHEAMDVCNRTAPFRYIFPYISVLCSESLKVKGISIWVDLSNNTHQEFSHL